MRSLKFTSPSLKSCNLYLADCQLFHPVVNLIICACSYFALLNKITAILSPSSLGAVADARLGALSSFAVGFAARAGVSALLLPLTVAKTRLEANGGAMLPTFRAIVAGEGIRALFRGLVPTVQTPSRSHSYLRHCAFLAGRCRMHEAKRLLAQHIPR